MTVLLTYVYGCNDSGSTNALAFTINGTDDPETGVIHIVLGGSLPLDVGAVHNHSGIARFIVGQMSYGYMADLMVHSENLRWMGPKRYDYAGKEVENVMSLSSDIYSRNQ